MPRANEAQFKLHKIGGILQFIWHHTIRYMICTGKRTGKLSV